MRAVVQRVSEASVTIEGRRVADIHSGLLVLLGISEDDTESDLEWLCGKILKLRIFPDDQGVMNLDVHQVHGDLLLVSQFTLLASTNKDPVTSGQRERMLQCHFTCVRNSFSVNYWASR